MTVINKIIEVVDENSEDSKKRTVYEKFEEFNYHLSWLAQEKQYQEILQTLCCNKDEGLQ
jgi:hypothetical protein